MQRYYLCLIERGVVIDDPEGQFFPDIEAATLDTMRQIRSMVSVEILEKGEADLTRAIEIVAQDGSARRVAFSQAISVSV